MLTEMLNEILSWKLHHLFCNILYKFWILGNKNKITVDIYNFKIFLKHELLYKSEVQKKKNERSEYVHLKSYYHSACSLYNIVCMYYCLYQ